MTNLPSPKVHAPSLVRADLSRPQGQASQRVRSRRARSRAGALGYTAVEVLVALTLFAVGTAGVLSLQRASIVGSSDARRTDVATAVGAEWIERLRQDSMAWNLPNAENPTAPSNHGTATKLLAPVVVGPVGTSDAGADTPWITAAIPANAAAMLDRGSPAYDLVGRPLLDTEVTTTGAAICVQYRLQWVVEPAVDQNGLMRAEVRVLYLAAGGRVGCVPGNGDPTTPTGFPNGFRSVNLTTTLRQNPT